MKNEYKYVLDSITNKVHYLNAVSGVFLCGLKPQAMDININWAQAHKLIHCDRCVKGLPGNVISLTGDVVNVYGSYEEAMEDFGDENG